MKTIIYVLFAISLSGVESGEITKAKYLKAVSTALKKGLLHDEAAFKLTMKVISI